MNPQSATNSSQARATDSNLEPENRQSLASVTMGDADDDRDEERRDARTTLYSHVLPERQDLTAEEWEQKKKDAIIKAMDEDLSKYEFGKPPDDPEAAERWRLEKEAELFRKIKKTIYAYTQQIKELPEEYTSEVLDKCFEDIEDDEDSYEFVRPRGMFSHEKWSEERQRQLEEQKSQDEDSEGKRQRMLDGAGGPPKDWDKGLDSTINSLLPEIPEEIRRIHKTMCIVIFQWWESGFSKEDSIKLAKLNSQLDTIKDGQKYKVAPTEIALWMPKLKKALDTCEQDPSEVMQKDLIKTAMTLTNRLRKSGLDWKMVIGRDTHRRFFNCIDENVSENISDLRSCFVESYLQPRPEQVDIVKHLASISMALISQNPDSESRIRPDNIPVVMEQFQAVNQKLQMCNSRLGLRQTDHNLPIADLENAFIMHLGGKTHESINNVLQFVYKVGLLQLGALEDLNRACTASKGVCDTLSAEKEVLDLCTVPQLSQLVEDIPSLSSSTHTFAFDGVPMKTVGWGDHLGRFYINQYGPNHAPVWRIERYPTPTWRSEHGNDPPQNYCVTNVMNRYGDAVDSSGKKKYGSEFVGAWYGVAFEDSLENIDPRRFDGAHSKSNSERRRLGRCYTLVGWDLKQEKMSFEKRWEIRSTIRRFVGITVGDIMIYNFAVRSEIRFRKYLRGEFEAQGIPEQVYREQKEVVTRSIKSEPSEQGPESKLQEILPIRGARKPRQTRREAYDDRSYQ